MPMRFGSCKCGQVGLQVDAEPKYVGICHCTDCRQESGSAFTFFGVWDVGHFQKSGETAEWEGRHFCPTCGSRLFSVDGNEAEIKLGVLDAAPTSLTPSYEIWVKRREAWLAPIPGTAQFDEDRI